MPEYKAVLKKILDSIYTDENNCIVCDIELKEKNRYGLCSRCEAIFPFNSGRTCVKCGKPIYDEAEYCMSCMNEDRYFDRVCSPLIYKGQVEKLILNYKFYNKRYLAKYFVSFLVDEYLNKGINADLIIPVPLTESVKRERTFNQTELLATLLGERLKLPVDNNIIKKVKETKHQATLSGKERQENIKGAFELIGKVKGKRVLIIDDILTTGATLSEVARVIRKGRPESVEGLTVANAEYKPYSE
jgi:ComF family protein